MVVGRASVVFGEGVRRGERIICEVWVNSEGDWHSWHRWKV